MIWYQKGDKEKALSDLNKAIQINPNFTIAYENRELVLQQKGVKQVVN
jgi:tetratricopeptide (TPR) repeat protein